MFGKNKGEGSAGPSKTKAEGSAGSSGDRKRSRFIAAAAGRLKIAFPSLVHLTAATSSRAANIATQPLVAVGVLTSLQASGLCFAFAVLFYGAVLAVRYPKYDGHSLREVWRAQRSGGRNIAFASLISGVAMVAKYRTIDRNSLRAVWSGTAEKQEAELKSGEKKVQIPGRWALILVPVGIVGLAFSGQFYSARLPFAAGNAIALWGPLTASACLTVVGRNRGWQIRLVFPLMSAVGAVFMIPWGHLDLAGALVAVLGGVFSAAVALGANVLALTYRVSMKAQGISLLLGLALGLPALLSIHDWSLEIILRGLIGGVLLTLMSVGYSISQAVLGLPARQATLLSGTGPALNGFLGWGFLGQAMTYWMGVGMATIFTSSLMSSGTGPRAEKPKRK